MTLCGVEKCPYYFQGICRARFTVLDINGMCQQIWRKGIQRADALDPIDDAIKTKVEIVTVTAFTPFNDADADKYHQITFDEYLAETGSEVATE